MPYYTEDEPEEKKEPCSGVKMELVECLLATDCVQKVNINTFFISNTKLQKPNKNKLFKWKTDSIQIYTIYASSHAVGFFKLLFLS